MRTKCTPRTENLLHRKYGRLTAIGYAGRTKGGQALWLWRCECGNYPTTAASPIKSGIVKSCGCLARELFIARNTIHGASPRGTSTSEYSSWENMIQRCTNPKNTKYDDYGGRGITICGRWRKFENFLADMGLKPTPKHEIERRDNNKGYDLDNCTWATRSQQMRNTRHTHWLTYNNETLSMAEWTERLGLPRNALYYRMKNNWTPERALTEPVVQRNRR